MNFNFRIISCRSFYVTLVCLFVCFYVINNGLKSPIVIVPLSPRPRKKERGKERERPEEGQIFEGVGLNL